MDDLVK